MTTTNVTSEVIGSVWKVEMKVGDRVESGDVIMILESMKMEIPLVAPVSGVVREVRVQPGSSVRAGQRVVVLEEA